MVNWSCMYVLRCQYFMPPCSAVLRNSADVTENRKGSHNPCDFHLYEDKLTWYSEYTTAIMCASLPHLKALVSKILPGYFNSAVRSLVSKRRSGAYRPSPLPINPENSAQAPDRRSTPHSLRYDRKASISRSSSRYPIMERKTELHDVDTNAEVVVLEAIRSPVPGDVIEFGTQVHARDHGSSRTRANEGFRHGENWPL